MSKKAQLSQLFGNGFNILKQIEVHADGEAVFYSATTTELMSILLK